MKYEYVMLDGMRVGVNVSDNGLELSPFELKVFMRIFKALKAKFYLERSEYIIPKRSKKSDDEGSTLRLGLRQSHHNKALWHFNIDGNPMAHFKGQNVYGNSDAGKQVRKTFDICLKWLEKKSGIRIPSTAYTSVGSGLINIHSLEFAAYTTKIYANIRALINGWQSIFRTSEWREDRRNLSLDKLLGVTTRIGEEEYEDSFAVASVERQQGRMYRLVSLRMYRKDQESPDLQPAVLDDIGSRLRMDVEFSSRWLSQKKLRTISDLEKLVEKKHGDSWKTFVRTEIFKVIDQACLRYMWVFPNVFTASEVAKIPKQWFEGIVDDEVKAWAEEANINPRISYKAHVAMVHARAQHEVEGSSKLSALASKEAYIEYANTLFANTTKVERLLITAVKNLNIENGEADVAI